MSDQASFVTITDPTTGEERRVMAAPIPADGAPETLPPAAMAVPSAQPQTVHETAADQAASLVLSGEPKRPTTFDIEVVMEDGTKAVKSWPLKFGAVNGAFTTKVMELLPGVGKLAEDDAGSVSTEKVGVLAEVTNSMLDALLMVLPRKAWQEVVDAWYTMSVKNADGEWSHPEDYMDQDKRSSFHLTLGEPPNFMIPQDQLIGSVVGIIGGESGVGAPKR